MGAIELAYGEAPYQRLHPLKVMGIIIEKDPPRIDKRRWDASFVSLIECCLQKDPKHRPTMDLLLEKQKTFLGKASEQPLLEILKRLAPLEDRIPPKPSWGPAGAEKGSKSSAAGGDKNISGSFDF